MTVGNSVKSVRVNHTVNDGVFDFAGHTVAEVQLALLDAFNLRSCDAAFVNGIEVDWNYILNAGDQLEFMHRYGHKGLGDMITPDELMRRWKITDEQYREFQNLGLPSIELDNNVILHPEFALDEWSKHFNIAPPPVVNNERHNTSQSLKTPPTTDPPLTHRFGPIEGTQKQIASWLHPYGNVDPRFLTRRAELGIISVRKIHFRLIEVWFGSQGELDRAKERRNESLQKLQKPM